jgi:hypothetical protein
MQASPVPAHIAGQLLAALLTTAPLLLVNAVGIVLAIVYWKRHPRASVLLVLGLGVLVVVPVLAALASTVGYPWLFRHARTDTVRTILPVVSGVWSVLTAVGHALIIWAVLADRRKPAQS